MSGRRAFDYAPGVGWLVGTLVGLAVDSDGYVGVLIFSLCMVIGVLAYLRWGTR